MASQDRCEEGRSDDRRRRPVLAWLPLLVLFGAMLVAYAAGWFDQLTLANLIRRRGELAAMVEESVAEAVLAYAGLYAVLVALSFPGASLLTIAGGFLFGVWICGPVTALAATIGATVVFLAARSSLGHALRARAGPFVGRLAAGFRADAWSYLLFLRLVPVFPFWLVNLAPALFNVPLRTYVITTFVGILPGTFAYAFLGQGLDSLIAAQEAANPGCAAAGTCSIEPAALITPTFLGALVALGLVALIPPAVRRVRGRQGGPE
ncbi:TVP38/TMEM64 family protein [Amorphus orientalis]|uniref:TVP38/TMEM64 family protein n=1 Tax=Amorphus orientalis TaxID=649198 RepID=UPI0027D79E9F|nr:TVP38/TMEM64 family protein [Amorphus orientalis]